MGNPGTTKLNPKSKVKSKPHTFPSGLGMGMDPGSDHVCVAPIHLRKYFIS